MKLNNKGFAVSGIIYALMFLFIILAFATLGLLGSRKIVLDKYKLEAMKNIEGNADIINVSKIDRSGAPTPILSSSMIPVIYDGGNWIKADYISDYDQNWYNYGDKKWANSVIIKEEVRENYENINPGTVINSEDILAYYVWIPRFRYKLFNADYENLNSNPSLIDISFEDVDILKSINNTNNEYLTHPAFTFGTDEIAGFWIGKFETTGSLDSISVLPNSSPILNKNIKEMYDSLDDNLTNLGIGTSDLHMLKNSEWSAVAYLSHSMYGQGNTEIRKNAYRKNNGFKTGCGYNTNSNTGTTTTCEMAFGASLEYLQSTTGNIYGVFDMVGGANEYVMAVMLDEEEEPLYMSSTFTNLTMPDDKYYNIYSYGESNTDLNTYIRGTLGSATKETWGWYSDDAKLVDSTGSWQIRGGASTDEENVGIFAFSNLTGEANVNTTFRTAIISE